MNLFKNLIAKYRRCLSYPHSCHKSSILSIYLQSFFSIPQDHRRLGAADLRPRRRGAFSQAGEVTQPGPGTRRSVNIFGADCKYFSSVRFWQNKYDLAQIFDTTIESHPLRISTGLKKFCRVCRVSQSEPNMVDSLWRFLWDFIHCCFSLSFQWLSEEGW